MKRVFVVHGWSGAPEKGWFPWLQHELEARQFEVIMPHMPLPRTPRIKRWVPALASAVGSADAHTFFVGHSMGCQTIVRYLETLPHGLKIGGAVFVSGFFSRITNLDQDPKAQAIDTEWATTPIDFLKVKTHMDKSTAIFSDNDKFVPLENAEDFKERLNSKTIIAHHMGHFSGPMDGVVELPIVLEELLKIAQD